jgi:hypothetical protein
MDLIRSARDEIACQEEGRGNEDFEGVEANDRCDGGESASAWHLVVHARLMILLAGPALRFFHLCVSRSGFDGSRISRQSSALPSPARSAAYDIERMNPPGEAVPPRRRPSKRNRRYRVSARRRRQFDRPDAVPCRQACPGTEERLYARHGAWEGAAQLPISTPARPDTRAHC